MKIENYTLKTSILIVNKCNNFPAYLLIYQINSCDMFFHPQIAYLNSKAKTGSKITKQKEKILSFFFSQKDKPNAAIIFKK